MEFLILTFVGNDRRGFVRELTEIVNRFEGTWLDSRMTRLEGKFVGLAKIGVDSEQVPALTKALHQAAQGQFTLAVEPAETASTEHAGKRWQLDVVGNDRPGILHDTSGALVEHDINVIEMSSSVTPASMSGIPMFSCTAIIEVSPDLAMPSLDARLAGIADELSVDIRLEPCSPEPD